MSSGSIFDALGDDRQCKFLNESSVTSAERGVLAPLCYASVLMAERALGSVATEASACVAKRSKKSEIRILERDEVNDTSESMLGLNIREMCTMCTDYSFFCDPLLEAESERKNYYV